MGSCFKLDTTLFYILGVVAGDQVPAEPSNLFLGVSLGILVPEVYLRVNIWLDWRVRGFQIRIGGGLMNLRSA